MKAALRAAWRPRGVVTGFIADMTRSHPELVAENALLRQQLIVAARAAKRPDLRPLERGLLAMLASILPHWRDTMLRVKPNTILRWHREGFRLFWRWRSTPKSKSKPRVDAGTSSSLDAWRARYADARRTPQRLPRCRVTARINQVASTAASWRGVSTTADAARRFNKPSSASTPAIRGPTQAGARHLASARQLLAAARQPRTLDISR
ncbi:MAG: hypothetical protein ABI548_25550 [Polyangiaceae bacterium]